MRPIHLAATSLLLALAACEAPVAPVSGAAGSAALTDDQAQIESMPHQDPKTEYYVNGRATTSLAEAQAAQTLSGEGPASDAPARQGLVRFLLSGAQVASTAAPQTGTWTSRMATAKSKGRSFATNTFEQQCVPVVPTNYTLMKALINVTAVAVQDAAGNWLTVTDYGPLGRTMDLVQLQNGTVEDLGAFDLEPGSYQQIRLQVTPTGNTVDIDQAGQTSTYPLFVPAPTDTGILLQHAFTVTTFGVMTLVLDFDANASITFNASAQRFDLNPMIAVAHDETNTAVSMLIPAATGGTLRILGDVTLTIPAGALAVDTTISLVPNYRLTPHAGKNLFIIGHEYALEPAGLTLAQPAQLTLNYPAVYGPVLGLAEADLKIQQLDPAARQWSPVATTANAGTGALTASVTTLGSFAVGGVPAGTAWTSAGCAGMAANVLNEAARSGLDANWLHAQCDRREQCYAHGFRTYRKVADGCNADFLTDATERCEQLCQGSAGGALFGKRCADLTPAEAQSAQQQGVLGLYGVCRLYAASVHDQAVANETTGYPGDAASTCVDYDGAGVACTAPTCAVTALPAQPYSNVPTDLDLVVTVTGSYYTAALDGQALLQSPLPALPRTDTGNVHIAQVKIADTRVFNVVLDSPSGVAAGCSVSVSAVPLAGCVLQVNPSSYTVGGAAATLTLTASQGFTTASVDLRTEGQLRQVGLTAPDADGRRYFVSSVAPAATRSFNAQVKDAAGNQATCSTTLPVVPAGP